MLGDGAQQLQVVCLGPPEAVDFGLVACRTHHCDLLVATVVCTENPIRVDGAMESPKLVE
jgi:hypothetical protein